MTKRLDYEIIRESPKPPPAKLVTITLTPQDIMILKRLLNDEFDCLEDDETSMTGMINKIAREIS